MHFVNSRNTFLHAINDKHLTNHFTQITYFLKSLPSTLFLKICFSKLFGLLITFVHLFNMVTPTFKIVNISNDMTSDIIITQHSLKQLFQHIHQIEMQGHNLKQLTQKWRNIPSSSISSSIPK